MMTIRLPSKPIPSSPISRTNPPERVVERLWNRYEVREDGCWISGYSTASHGYAQIGWKEGGERRLWLAHRIAWYATHGDIPDGMTVDHICRTRTCINPDHLRLMTNWDNARRNNQGGSDDYPSDWSCKRNHGFEHRSKVTRACLKCHKLHNEKYLRRKKSMLD